MKVNHILLLITSFLLITHNGYSQTYTIENQWLQPTDGEVNDIKIDSTHNKMYIAGSFNDFAYKESYSTGLNITSALPNFNYANPNGIVTSCISDENGGWFIGGEFTQVGDSIRSRIAHLDSLGRVTSLFSNKGVDNSVLSMSLKNNILYLGGNFQNYGESNPFYAIYSDSTILENLPKSNGHIYASISDGSGGWFIGGKFSKIGDSLRSNLAHINNLGHVSGWKADLNGSGSVSVLVLHNSDLYVGGIFNEINSIERNSIASINKNTGAVNSWNPNANINASISSINIFNTSVFVGGFFNSIGGQPRNNFAELNMFNALSTTWNPNPNGVVNTIVNDGNNIYIGGGFTTIDFTFRNRLVSFNLTTKIINNWDPNANNIVSKLYLKDTTIFVGGQFNIIAGQSRTYIAEISKFNSLVTNFNLSISGSIGSVFIKDLNVIDSNLYICGSFNNINGINRNNVAAINLNSGSILNWNPNPNNTVTNLSFHGTKVFVGGNFNFIDGIKRNYLLSIDLNLNEITSWNPNPNNTVMSIINKDSLIYIGGFFNNVGGESRTNFAVLNSAGITTSLNFVFMNGFTSPKVNIIELKGDTLFFGGKFSTINGLSRSNFAGINLNSGLILDWNPIINNTVRSIKCNASTLYIGGDFGNVNGQARSRIASFNIMNGNLNNWNPILNGTKVSSIELKDSNIFICGDFSSVNNEERISVASFNSINGDLNLWNCKVNYNAKINSILCFNNTVFIGGEFGYVGKVDRSFLIQIDLLNNQVTSWNPKPNQTVKSIFVSDSNVIIGGDFTSIDSLSISYFAKIDKFNGLVSSWNAQINGPVFDIDNLNSKLYIAGSFSQAGGAIRNNLAAFNINSFELDDWNPNSNDDVLTITHSDSLIFVGGLFTNIGGIVRTRIASLDTLFGSLTNWNPEVNGDVRTIEVDENNLYVGGGFTIFSNVTRNRFASINLLNNELNTFSPTFNNSINNISIKDSFIFIGGIFTTVNGTNRNSFAFFDKNNKILLSWHPGVFYSSFVVNNNSNVISTFSKINIINVSDGFLFIGGMFDLLNPKSSNFIASNINCPITYSTEYINACDSILINSEVFTQSGTYSYVTHNQCGSDSIVVLNIIIYTPLNSNTNIFSIPSATSCTGQLAITTTGNPDFEMSIDGTTPFTSSGYTLQSNICPGIHELSVIDFCGDTVSQPFVIPIDSNYVFNNPFIDSIAVDSLGTTITNCDIYYNSIDTAYIDSLWATGNQVNVIWNIVDSNGSNLDTTTYDLMNGSGVYWLQLSVFCPTKAVDDYFTVTQAIYFGNGGAYLVGLKDNQELENSIGLYPNPTSNSVTVTFTSNSTARVQLLDAQGKFIQESTINSGDQISLDYLDRGVYFLNVEMNGKSICKKIIKQ